MPSVTVHGTKKHFPYTPKGVAAAKADAKKNGGVLRFNRSTKSKMTPKEFEKSQQDNALDQNKSRRGIQEGSRIDKRQDNKVLNKINSNRK